MEKGNIASWKVKVGDKVKAGDVMAEVRHMENKAYAFPLVASSLLTVAIRIIFVCVALLGRD